MDYCKLRMLVGHADAEARLVRAVQCYKNQLVEGIRERPLPFDEKEVPALAARAAWSENRYGFYTPSIRERVSNCCISKRVRTSARARYTNKELDDVEVNLCISNLKATKVGMAIGYALKRHLPLRTKIELKRGFKRSIK